jgi:ribosomal protein L11 methyltransferase
MSKIYIEIDVAVDIDFAEIILAELAELGFDSFIDSDSGFLGYIEEDLFDDISVKKMLETYSSKTGISYSFKAIEKENWNQTWESNFSPIVVDDKIQVRAGFHESAGLPLEIIITPKMSFGTGHHETTHQVMSLQLEINHTCKTVLDVGTGTGILAILASKLGSSHIHAFDIDDWSVENTLENIDLNHTANITVSKGTIKDQAAETYDIVLANINRNILLDEIPMYVNFLKPGGLIIMSGFYLHDIEDIAALANTHHLKKIKHSSRNEWAAVVFSKEA